jgi:peptidoglycan/LPS O-acetylase OafA/YrhL
MSVTGAMLRRGTSVRDPRVERGADTDVARRDPPAPGYNPALDGLRGLAIIAVLAYHLYPAALPGGFIGVDVFFVLSGYLITSLLLREWSGTGGIDLRRFWSRRIRRLMPALAVTVGGVLAFEWAVNGAISTRLRDDAVASLSYVANWRFALSGQSYFEQFGAPSPLRHTWSLAIEEQWYLVWPILLRVVLRVGGRRLAAIVCSAGATASAVLLWAVAYQRPDTSRAYYGTDCRAFTLLAGSLLAVVLADRVVSKRLGRVVAAAALLAVAALVVGSVRLDGSMSFMYVTGFAAVAAVSVVAVAGCALTTERQRPTWFATAVGIAPLRVIGKLSYSLYLVHWPVIVLLNSNRLGVDDDWLPVAQLAITVVLAAISYAVVEQPLRRWNWRAVPALTVVGTAALIAATVTVIPSRVDRTTDANAAPVAEPGITGQGDVRLLLLGDSVAASLSGGLPAAELQRLTVDVVATPGCGLAADRIYTNGAELPRNADCIERELAWRTEASSFRPHVALVVLGGWELFDVFDEGRRLEFGTAEWDAYMIRRLDEWLAPVRAQGGIAVFTDIPCFSKADNPNPDGPGRERYEPDRAAHVNELVGAYATRKGDAVVELSQLLCAGSSDTPVDRADRWDGLHFSDPGATRFWQWLEPQIIELPQVLAVLS